MASRKAARALQKVTVSAFCGPQSFINRTGFSELHALELNHVLRGGGSLHDQQGSSCFAAWLKGVWGLNMEYSWVLAMSYGMGDH